ncbi:isopentenyl phosphate kinase-like [Pomacea canaliculata]|uniref:isopentenyl phosphate kinase-like n=1 Tax=Pomacea canaliculata TaxID=400727 RepID=UPI000D72C55B|nr:isopentenyl phosphate kinase-like [Pomacea canaliculata]
MESDRKSTTLDLIVKFGGAAITDKSSLETLKPDQLDYGASIIEECYKLGQTVVVVHGAGSFGHHHASKYNINQGFFQGESHLGFCLTRQSVTKLNKHIVDSLISRNVPAVACSPFPTWQTDKKAVVAWPKEVIQNVLTSRLVPVFHGDCVLDAAQGCCILSGDLIIKTLCENFNVKRVVFLTDVYGVYDRPPCSQGAKLLQQISTFADGIIEEHIHTSNISQDVTGGMLNKLQAACSIVRMSRGKTRTFICKIDSHDAVKLCIEQRENCKDLQATEIVLKQK